MSFEFLRELFTPYSRENTALTEIRLISGRDGCLSRYFGPSKLDAAADFCREQSAYYDVYVGVLPRSQVAAPGKAGEDWHVDQAAWLPVDIDRGAATDAQMIDYLAGVRKRLPKPRMMVLSGSGGAHLYWRLPEVHQMPDEPARKSFTSILRRLVLACGSGEAGLHADKSCTNVSRILRVPGTFNHKHSPPAKVSGIIYDDYDQMPLSGWDAILPWEPAPPPRPQFRAGGAYADRQGVPPGLLRWAQAGYPEGNRHHDIVGAAAWLRRETDLPENVAYELFLTKAQNSPGRRPLTEAELDKAWAWGGRA